MATMRERPQWATQAGRRGGGEDDAVFAGFENRLDVAGVGLAQGDAGRVRKQEANGDGLRLAAQVEAEKEVVRAKAEEEFLPDAIALEHGGLLLGEVELARAEPVEVAFGLCRKYRARAGAAAACSRARSWAGRWGRRDGPAVRRRGCDRRSGDGAGRVRRRESRCRW